MKLLSLRNKFGHWEVVCYTYGVSDFKQIKNITEFKSLLKYNRVKFYSKESLAVGYSIGKIYKIDECSYLTIEFTTAEEVWDIIKELNLICEII
jgi:hypothetical protein